jgi:acetyl esterase/lipase
MISLSLKKLVQSNFSPTLNIEKLRWDDFYKPSPSAKKNCNTEEVIIHGVNCYWMTPEKKKSEKIILYFHGGGFVCGPSLLQWRMLSHISKETGITSIMANYRMAPEHPYPAAMDDMMNIYRDLLLYREAENIIFMGDSAGAGLALSLAMKLRDEGISLPQKLVLLSPWLDVTMENPLIPEVEKLDQMLAVSGLVEAGKFYAGNENPLNPYVSPLFGTLEGLPPILLQIGTHDMLVCDCRILKEKADETGFFLNYEEWDEMFHVWMLNVPYLPEANRAVAKIEEFLLS